MSSYNKKYFIKRSLYAEDRRKQDRIVQEARTRADVEQQLSHYFQEFKFDEMVDIASYYPAIEAFIKHKAQNLTWKKYAHEFFRAYITQCNKSRNEALPVPNLTFEMKRDRPVFSMDWVQNGHHIDEIIEKIWNYWILAKDSLTFSDDEIIGNILISAILYAGLNQRASLDALLDHLKDPYKIKKILDINIIFLEPLSPTYGDLYIDDKTIRKSRNFIPDQITRLWLIHFNNRNIRNVNGKVEEYLELIFKQSMISFSSKTYKFLRDYANFNWMQLPNSDIDPALSQCLIENTATCGLSETEFKRFLYPVFNFLQNSVTYSNSENLSETIVHTYRSEDIQKTLSDVIKIHKDLLKLIRTQKSDQKIERLIIDYCIQNSKKFNEYSKRIALWLISLYKPQSDLIQPLTEIFNVCFKQYQKSFQQNQPLVENSIYTYYCRIAEPWLTHSLQYLESEDDININLAKIYHHIMTNTRLADEAEQPDFKKSKAVTSRMLKRFHQFQQVVFHAESIEFESVGIQQRPKARIIGPLTYQAFMNKLDTIFMNRGLQDNFYKTLKIIYILAYRTGMRINEILGLRVQDIEGLSDLSVWIQPYGSKKQGNLHQLKTDSAQRTIPVYCLLKANEYQLFHSYVIEQRLLNQKNLYLLRDWNQNTKLTKNTVTTPFKMIMNELFKEHDYSFHSFRHTTANHLSVLLNCEYDPIVKHLTDYTETEYCLIRKSLLRNTHGQNHWFIIAHILGHIDPTETFKSYIHLSYLIAGHKLLKYHPDIDTELAKKMMGYLPSFNFLNSVKDSKLFDFNKYSDHLSQQLLNDQTGWLNSNIEDIHNQFISSSEPHDYFKYFAGTEASRISLLHFFETLNLLEIHNDPKYVSQLMCLPFELIEYWHTNAKELANLKSNKGNLRLFSKNNVTRLKPAMVDTKDELIAVEHFFQNLQILSIKKPEEICYVLKIFLERVTFSHTGIHYRWKDIDKLEKFYELAEPLFPTKFWQLLGNNLTIKIDRKKHPKLFKLMNSSLHTNLKCHENFPRLQLYSLNDKSALAAFKFCLHLACIGRPLSLNLFNKT